jgi:hypothetical protein
MLRTDTPLNEIIEAVIVRLKTISAKKDSEFLTTPKWVGRLPLAGDFAGRQKPVLSVSVGSWEAEAQAANRFDGVLTIQVHCITENTDDAERELLRLVSDAMLALNRDITLSGEAIYLFPRMFEPNVDLSNRSGLAVATITFECRYRFDSTAP